MEDHGKLWIKINFDSTKQNTDDGEIADDYWSNSKTVFSASHLFAIYIYISTVSTCIDMSCIQCMCIYIYTYIHNCIYIYVYSNPF